MLLPTQLKVPEMNFIEEEDLLDEEDLRKSCQELPKPPLTGFQKVRINKQVAEEEQAEQDVIPADERERTIRCLLKVMDYEIEGVKSQYTDIQNAMRKQDGELEDFER